jgi:hypothetical protein
LLGLDPIEKPAEVFSLNALERENRPGRGAKNEFGDRASGQRLPWRTVR